MSDHDAHLCQCGEDFDSTKMLKGHIAASDSETCGIAATAGNVPDADERASDTEPMTETTDADETQASDDEQTTAESSAETFEEEVDTLLPGADPLRNLMVKRTGLTTYVVLSARNGSLTRHEVALYEPSCTCDDWKYNADDDREVCAHYAAAHMEAEDVTANQIAVHDAANLCREARELKNEAEAALDSAQEANVIARDAEAHAKQQAVDATEQNADDGQKAQTAADRLQSAFDEVIDDMRVKAHAGKVWYQTGSETPDDWPFPGGGDTFNVVTSPECVSYVHDGSAEWADSPHPLYDDKPGEWWKNCLDPEDVEQYIAEVLE